MAGQWEVVGKKKEKSVKSQKNETTKKVENIKVEDVLAKSQVKNLYANGKNKENKSVEIKKNAEVGTKKTQKKQEKAPEKPKPPKSIESALNQIDVEEFGNLLAKSKSQFPDAPIVWLKELSHFLNQKININVEDVVFSAKPQRYPLAIVPPGIKSVIEKAVHEAKKTNVQLFFDISLTTLTTEMGKNVQALGLKLFLQYIALNDPNLIVASLAKHCALRNSYQNRPNIGLSILWSVGQAGITDFQTGLQIFQELMLPVIELKNYTRYVVKYLIDLISKTDSSASLTKQQYITILEILFVNKKHFPNDLKQELASVAPQLKLLFCNSDEFNSSLEFLLKKIGTTDSIAFQQNICEVIVESFVKDDTNLDNWSKIYAKYIPSSALLLQHLDRCWKNVSSKLNRNKLRKTLNGIVATNNDILLKKKKDAIAAKCSEVSEKLLEKMSEKRKPRSSFKFTFFLISLIATIIVYYDIRQEGSWQNSKTNRVLKNWGICEYSHKISDKLKEGLLSVDKQIEENFPEHRRVVIEFSEPYVELLNKLGRIIYNLGCNVKEAVLEKYPIFIQSVESYAPSILEQSQNVVSGVWSTSVLYFHRSVDYLKTEVFVGQLSPENMQKVVVKAFNVTQIKATEYYYWLYEKVQSTIK